MVRPYVSVPLPSQLMPSARAVSASVAAAPQVPGPAPCATGLARLRRVDAMQSVTHVIDVDRVCIDHADLARRRDFDHGGRGDHTAASASTAASGQHDNRRQDRKC